MSGGANSAGDRLLVTRRSWLLDIEECRNMLDRLMRSR